MCSSTVETTAFVRALSKASGRKSLIDHIVSCGYDLRKRDWITINFPDRKMIFGGVTRLNIGNDWHFKTGNTEKIPPETLTKLADSYF